MADEMLINGLIKFCDAKSKNMELKAEPQVYVEIKCALEELRAIKTDGFTDHLLNMGYTKGYNKAIDEFAEVLKEICKNYPISNDGHTPLYIHEDGKYHELIEDAVKQMKGGGNSED